MCMKASCWNTRRTKTDYIRSKLFEHLWYIMIKVGLVIMLYHISYVALSVADKEAEGALTLSLVTFPNSANVSSESTNLPTVAVK